MISMIVIGLLGLLCLSLVWKLRHIRGELDRIREVLKDIRAGNENRRILGGQGEMTEPICHDINAIALESRERLMEQRQREQAYRSLMTGLSHDVKTPLASLVGYLEAVREGMVSGAEREEYLAVALSKANYLKEFTERLFDWVKLDSGEWKFEFAERDVSELTRMAVGAWIPLWEERGINYEIRIPERACFLRIDENAYVRSLDNLFHNARIHSGCRTIAVDAEEDGELFRLVIRDDGKGISERDLPQIFDRMYRADPARSDGGSGLGLAITKELVRVNGGTIVAESGEGEGTAFTLVFAKSRPRG